MPSNASRGAYWKARSKKWLLEQGFLVADMEIQRTVWGGGLMIPTKKDQWGADLMYSDGVVFVHVQVKGGLKPTSTLLKAAQRGFDAFRFPTHSRRELHVWRPRARVPEIVRCQ